jgi:aspartate racemase
MEAAASRTEREQVKKLGIVGGIAPESTVAYYRMIVAAYKRARPDGSYPELVIDCIDVTKMLGLIADGKLDEVTAYIANSVNNLAAAGAEFALLASNTPHVVFDRLQRNSPVPLLSIVDAATEAGKQQGLRRIALLGTRFTMQASFYPEGFARHGISVIAPEAQEQDFIHEKYVKELIPAQFLPETRNAVIDIVSVMKSRSGIDGVLLAGTELPLLLPEPEYLGIPFLDTGRIHAEAAVREILA